MIAIAFSGGKDSWAATLDILDRIPDRLQSRVELWHHGVDGAPGSPNAFDWPCTLGYCDASGAALGLPVLHSWREGGLYREMLRDQTPTAAVTFETPTGDRITSGGESHKLGTRKVFPQVSGDLSVRWCSAYAKIMVCASQINNDPRLKMANILLVSGERRDESPGRAKYAVLDRHRSTTLERRVDQYRPVLDYTEADVWGILARHGILAHPCYWLGFGRASCETCIFSEEDEWATLTELDPVRVDFKAKLERWTGKSIARQECPLHPSARVEDDRCVKCGGPVERPWIPVRAAQGTSFLPPGSALWQKLALHAGLYPIPVKVHPRDWRLPPGAFRTTAGPT